MLGFDDPVFKEWWTKYPGFVDCCGECPGCCAIEYDDNTESLKDPSLGLLGRLTSIIFSTIHDDISMSLGQW
jgi:hypothetical protein